jgi:hypothetical protein
MTDRRVNHRLERVDRAREGLLTVSEGLSLTAIKP